MNREVIRDFYHEKGALSPSEDEEVKGPSTESTRGPAPRAPLQRSGGLVARAKKAAA